MSRNKRLTSWNVDFNEIVLDFLSQPDVVVQDRLKELSNASKVSSSFTSLHQSAYA
jgi:hypothetical protein